MRYANTYFLPSQCTEYPSLFYSAPIEGIRNEANERCKPLYIIVYPVPRICMSRIYPPPPLYRCICEHPSSPEFFFIFFLHPIFLPDFLKFFILILCCDILRYLSGLICKIILFIIVMMFALYVDVFAMQCVYEPLSLYS